MYVVFLSFPPLNTSSGVDDWASHSRGDFQIEQHPDPVSFPRQLAHFSKQRTFRNKCKH